MNTLEIDLEPVWHGSQLRWPKSTPTIVIKKKTDIDKVMIKSRDIPKVC